MGNEISLVEITEARSLVKGDVLVTLGGGILGTYGHFGIFLGHQVGVAEFGAYGQLQKDCLRIQDLNIFKGLEKLFRAEYDPLECRNADDVASTAEYYVNHPEEWPVYHLISNNCEHFANYCKTGSKYSKQTRITPTYFHCKMFNKPWSPYPSSSIKCCSSGSVAGSSGYSGSSGSGGSSGSSGSGGSIGSGGSGSSCLVS